MYRSVTFECHCNSSVLSNEKYSSMSCIHYIHCNSSVLLNEKYSSMCCILYRHCNSSVLLYEKYSSVSCVLDILVYDTTISLTSGIIGRF